MLSLKESDSLAQGAIEYLLVIGAAILVITVVVIAISSVLQGETSGANDSQKQLDASLSGVQDLMNKSLGQVRVVLHFIGGKENKISFSSLIENKISEVFDTVPVGTTITIPTCTGFNTSPVIGTKTNTSWSPENFGNCTVPIGEVILVYPLTTIDIEIVVDENKLPIIPIQNSSDFSAIANNPAGMYVLTTDIRITDTLNEPFSGTLDGNNHAITVYCLSQPCPPILSKITKGAKINNLIINPVVDKTPIQSLTPPEEGLLQGISCEDIPTNIHFDLETKIKTTDLSEFCNSNSASENECLYGCKRITIPEIHISSESGFYSIELNPKGSYVLDENITIIQGIPSFEGTFNGQGHSIKIMCSSELCAPIFNDVKSPAKISNLIIDAENNTATYNSYAPANGFISINCNLSLLNPTVALVPDPRIFPIGKKDPCIKSTTSIRKCIYGC